MNTKNRARATFFCLISAAALVACQPPASPATARVDATTQDTTSASALWLQADIPGRPLSNVYLKGSPGNSDLSVAVDQTSVVTLTALATDNDSGIRSLSLDALVTVQRLGAGNSWFKLLDHVSRSFGVTSVPLTIPRDVPLTARVTGTVDFGTLSQGADWVVVHVVAVAESGAPPAPRVQTHTMSLYWKRPGTPP
ncbi:MAG: hypothetical protein ACT4UQ_06090 [Gammaproteobacteria bacterium]